MPGTQYIVTCPLVVGQALSVTSPAFNHECCGLKPACAPLCLAKHTGWTNPRTPHHLPAHRVSVLVKKVWTVAEA
eukprot:5625864-Amphidinium_carterae.1